MFPRYILYLLRVTQEHFSNNLIAPRWSSLVVGLISLTIFTVSRWFPWKTSKTKVTYFQFLKIARIRDSWWYIRWYTVRILAAFVVVPLFRPVPRFSFSLETTVTNVRISSCQTALVIYHGKVVRTFCFCQRMESFHLRSQRAFIARASLSS